MIKVIIISGNKEGALVEPDACFPASISLATPHRIRVSPK